MLTLVLVSALSQLSLSGAPEGGLGLNGGKPPVLVLIETDDPQVKLFRHLGTQVGTVWTGQGTGTVVVNHFSAECQAPCGELVARPGDQFFVGGDGVTTSSAFSLLDHGNSVTLKVQAGRAWMRWLGATSLIMGVTVLLTSAILYGVSALSGGNAGAPNPYGSATSSGTLATIGLGGLIGGGLLTIAGIPLFTFGGTKVEFLPGPAAPVAPTPTTADL